MQFKERNQKEELFKEKGKLYPNTSEHFRAAQLSQI